MPQIQHTDFYSHILGMSLSIEVTGHYGYPVVMFPTSKGAYTQNRDFGLNASIDNLTEQGKLKLYNLQTIDGLSLYDRGIQPADRIRNYDLYVQFLIKEYIPYLQKMHQTHRVAMAGASFGGFHAANFAFRFPDVVSHLVCMSGAFSVRGFMDGYSDHSVYQNSPREYMQHSEAWRYRHMKIVLSTSDEDICLAPTQEMAGILAARGIDRWYDERKWISHDWPLWRMVFPKFMNTFFS